MSSGGAERARRQQSDLGCSGRVRLGGAGSAWSVEWVGGLGKGVFDRSLHGGRRSLTHDGSYTGLRAEGGLRTAPYAPGSACPGSCFGMVCGLRPSGCCARADEGEFWGPHWVRGLTRCQLTGRHLARCQQTTIRLLQGCAVRAVACQRWIEGQEGAGGLPRGCGALCLVSPRPRPHSFV